MYYYVYDLKFLTVWDCNNDFYKYIYLFSIRNLEAFKDLEPKSREIPNNTNRFFRQFSWLYRLNYFIVIEHISSPCVNS